MKNARRSYARPEGKVQVRMATNENSDIKAKIDTALEALRALKTVKTP